MENNAPDSIMSIVPLIVIGLLLLMAVAAILFFAFRRKPSPIRASAYTTHFHLLQPDEELFFRGLQSLFAQDWVIFAKVRLADLVQVAPGGDHDSQRRAFERIAPQNVDFVLCRADNLQVVGVIEITDRGQPRNTHDRRDPEVDTILEQSRIPVMKVRQQKEYDWNAVRTQLMREFRLG